jgi:hypothetical protein
MRIRFTADCDTCDREDTAGGKLGILASSQFIAYSTWDDGTDMTALAGAHHMTRET